MHEVGCGEGRCEGVGLCEGLTAWLGGRWAIDGPGACERADGECPAAGIVAGRVVWDEVDVVRVAEGETDGAPAFADAAGDAVLEATPPVGWLPAGEAWPHALRTSAVTSPSEDIHTMFRGVV